MRYGKIGTLLIAEITNHPTVNKTSLSKLDRIRRHLTFYLKSMQIQILRAYPCLLIQQIVLYLCQISEFEVQSAKKGAFLQFIIWV